MIRSILKTMRPYQWIKNIFLFAALIFDRQLFYLPSLSKTIAAFFLFSLLSGSVYIINDILDVESDKNHPKKKNRPIAAGKLSIPVASITAAIIVIISLAISFYISTSFGVVALIYFVLNLIYSTWLKHIPLIDVLVLASFYLLRVGAGVSIINVQRFSPWLYVVTTLFALFIGFGKRRAELCLLDENANSTRKVLDGYSVPLLDQLITIVSTTTIVAYSFYTFSAPNVPDNHYMMLSIPFVLYGIFRYLYLVQIKKEGGAPEEIALKDRPIQITVMLWGLTVVMVFYFF